MIGIISVTITYKEVRQTLIRNPARLFVSIIKFVNTLIAVFTVHLSMHWVRFNMMKLSKNTTTPTTMMATCDPLIFAIVGEFAIMALLTLVLAPIWIIKAIRHTNMTAEAPINSGITESIVRADMSLVK